jgi:hypothetical protein
MSGTSHEGHGGNGGNIPSPTATRYIEIPITMEQLRTAIEAVRTYDGTFTIGTHELSIGRTPIGGNSMRTETWDDRLTPTEAVRPEEVLAEQPIRRVFIIGVGGVGSNLAWLLAHEKVKLVLVDYDVVEPKNLGRQFFTKADIGKKKVEALRDNLLNMMPEADIEILDRKIEDKMDMLSIADDSLDTVVVGATDNFAIKKMICETYKCGVMISCEEHEYEVIQRLRKEDKTAWTMADGYMSTQTWESNMKAAELFYHYFKHKPHLIKTKNINAKMMVEEI